ncbi:MAG: 23S rRNA (guanosine(2251)-2'-O)-methyltransferase RlmB [Ignavibacteriales bacterium]|nr:23S rRNA (guanosine(2251)-2'-O)-methyltransferase RlmB [Ignavibacteriales bacterium]
MADIIVGRRPVLEALKAGQPIEKILVQYGTHGGGIDSIYKAAKQVGIPITQAAKEKFREIAGDQLTQGVLALVSPIPYVEVEDILEIARKRNEAPFLLILDEIEDPHNVGALIRTGECAGIHGVVIPRHHAATVNETVMKTSAGAIAHVSVARVSNIVQTLEQLKQNNVWIVGADTSGEKVYFDVDYKGPIGIVVGNEGKGMRRLVKERCDFVVRIPLFGKIESLNASVAGGFVMYEVARQRHAQAN